MPESTCCATPRPGTSSEARDDRQDERDDLVFRRSGDAGADGEEAAGHEDAAEIGGDDDAVVGLAEIIDRDPNRKRQATEIAVNAHAAKYLPATLAKSRAAASSRARCCRISLLGPQPHAQSRHEQQVEPRVPVEERAEIGLSGLEEAAVEEREQPETTRKITMNTYAIGVAK